MGSDRNATAEVRKTLIQEWFPEGIPRLWCPPLTHYTDAGALDRRRIEAHLRTLAPDAPGWLVPGSTGDGWELSREEIRALLDLVFAVAQEHGTHVLIGALRKEHREAGEEIDDLVNWMRHRAATTDTITAFVNIASADLPSARPPESSGRKAKSAKLWWRFCNATCR